MGRNNPIPNLAPQAMEEKWILDSGGTDLTKDNAQTILRGQSKTPNCFVLLNDDNDLVKETMTMAERLHKRVAGNYSTICLESSELEHIVDSLYSDSVINSTA